MSADALEHDPHQTAAWWEPRLMSLLPTKLMNAGLSEEFGNGRCTGIAGSGAAIAVESNIFLPN